MRILMVNKFLYPNGGSETYLFKVGAQLQATGHEVQYFGMEHEGRIVGNEAGVYTASMDFHGGSKLSKLSYPFQILYSKAAKEDIKKVLASFHADVVHLNNINFQLTPSIIDGIKEFDPKIRIVFTAHDAQWVCPNHLLRIPSTGEVCTRCIDGAVGNCTRNKCIHNSMFRSLLGTMEARLYQIKKTYALVDKVVCPSDFLNGVLSHNPQLKGGTVTLHNFVDLEQEEAADETREAVSRDPVISDEADVSNVAVSPKESAWGCDKTEKATGADRSYNSEKYMQLPKRYVLYFGRYTKEKGVSTLLEAAKSLPEISFVFAGKGELKDDIDQTVNAKEVGFLEGETLRKVIRRAAFVVFPSEWYENGPFVVIESIMNGTPILASSLGGTPEMIAEGETGELFEAGNVQQLTEKIRSLYQDEERLLRYRRGCQETADGKGSVRFDSLEEYCEKLVREIYPQQ